MAYRDWAIDIHAYVETYSGYFQSLPDWSTIKSTLQQQTWNAFASLPSASRLAFRQALKKSLQFLEEHPDDDPSSKPEFLPLDSVTTHLPFDTRNYSDFYCSYEHAKNCSDIFKLQMSPNWFHLPQVYNGRTSSLAVSGTPITRPCGIFPSEPGAPPTLQPEMKLDFELEMGVWISNPVPRGERLDISKAKDHIFGITLLNDWSARSIQFYEMQPLGPFHSKGSLTSISPWIVPIEALNENAACPRHSKQDPEPLPHLAWKGEEDKATWNINVKCVLVREGKEYTMSESNLNELHWTPLQQVTHLASAGEGLSAGDVSGTGTISSARTNEKGEKTGLSCIWERRCEGASLSSLPDGVEEGLLLDGDEVVMSAWVENRKEPGTMLFGFGECRGKVLPAKKVEQ